MNKVFKVVYSKSKGCYVVVPETAKNNNGKKKVLASVLAGLAVAGVIGGIAPQQAMAGYDTSGSHVNIWADTSPKSNGQNYNVGQNSIVVGYQNTTDNVAGHDGKVAIGAKNTSTNNASTAVGNENKATGGAATAVGAGNTASGNASVALGNVNNADAKAAIAIGTYNNVNYTKGSWETTPKKAGEYSTVVGNYSSATGTSASAMGVYTNATGAGSFAAGYNNNAKGQNSVAIGSENTSHVADTVTLGQFNNAKTMGGISIGKNNLTDSTNGGVNFSKTRDENSQIAIGRDNTATHLDTIAIGRDTHATGSGATVIGARADASGDNSIAIGNSGKNSDRVTASGDNSIAIGMRSQATGEAAIAQGGGAQAQGQYGIAVGRYAKASAKETVAMGNEADANIANGVALGDHSVTTTDKGVLGYNPSNPHERKYKPLKGNVQTATTAAVSIGNGETLTRQLTGLAAGTADTDAVNVAQLKNVGVAVTGNTGSSDFLADGGKLNVIGEGRVSTVAAHDGDKDSRITVGFDDKGMVKAGKNVKVDEVTVNGKTTYTIHAADAAAKYDFLTNAKANGGKLDGTATPTKVESGTTVSYAAGKNLTVKQDINQSAGEQTYTYSLNKDLKEITSITNNGGPTMNFGDNNISITGGNLDLGGNNITNLNSGGDVINNAANIGDVTRISKANDLHIAPTAGTNNNVAEYTVDGNKKVTLTYQDGNGKPVTGPKAVIDLSGLPTGDMSSFNVKSSATEGKVAQGSAGVQEIRDGKTVEMQAGKNMTIKQTNKNGNAAVEFALNKDIDLTPDGSIKIGDTNITDNGLTINGGPSITKTGINAGDLKITNVKAGVNDNDAVNVSQLKQVRSDERHIKPGEYAVDNNGKVTMTYVDGNNKDVANETAVITGIAKQDLSNINKGGETVIQNLAKKSIDMENGKNTKVSNREINGVKTFKVDVEGDLTDITSITNKGGDGKVVFGGNQTVNVAGDHNINLNAKVGDITGLTNVTLDAPDFAKKGRAATEEQLSIVNNGFNNTVGLTGNTGATELQKLNKQGGLSFGVVGANNGEYITTTASGSNVVADLSNSAKNKLNSTVVVEGKNAAKVTSNVIQNADGSTKTVYTVDVNNVKPTAASTEKVQAKADVAGSSDKNIAKVAPKAGENFGDAGATYEVNVSRNDVKDAAREAVTVNTTNSKNNPITVTPVQDETNHNTTYTVTFDGNKAATQIPLTYKANGQNAQTVTLDKGLNFTNGSNTTASVAADGVVKYDLNNNIDLTPNGSLKIGDTIVNDGGLTIKNGPSVTKTGINAGNLNITNVKAGVNDTDAVNVKQLKDARTVVTSNDNSVTVNKTENGNQVTYDLHVAPGAAQSVWNVKSTGNTTADSETTAKTISDGKTVEMAAGKNLTVKQTSNNDGAKVEYALSDDIKVGNDGKDGKPGKDGSIGVNGKDGSSVVINGKDGSIGLNGKDGKDGLTMKGEKGQPGVNGKDGITRIVYEDKTNTKHEVATLDDGLNFTGNNTDTVNKQKLNSLVKVQGEGVDKTASASFKSASGNINVKADGTDTLEVQLNKDLKNITTIKNDGPATLTIGGNEFKFSGGNVNMGDNNITNLKSGGDVINNAANIGDVTRISKANDLHIAPTTSNRTGETTATYAYNTADKSVTLKYNDGNGATQTGTIAKIDLSGLADQIKDGYSFSTDAKGNVVGNHAVTAVGNGKTVSYAAGDNLTVKQDIDAITGEHTYTYALSNDIKVGKDGKDGIDGKIGVNGKDGSAVVINGKDGSIGLNGKDGKDGLTMKAKDGQPGVNGKDGITRIVYEDHNHDKHEVATLDDGMKYAGDDAQGTDKSKVIAKKLNETMDVVGGADKSKLTDNNIGVNNVDGKLKVQLSKEVNLTPSGSLTIGDTVVNNNGLTISGGPSIVKTGINAGNLNITNVKAGVNDTDAVNVKQLKDARTVVTSNDNSVTVNKTENGNQVTYDLHVAPGAAQSVWNVKSTGNTTADSETAAKTISDGKTVEMAAGKNLTVKQTSNNDGAKVEFDLANDIKIGKDGRDGVDGKIGVNGKDGSSVVINGKDGSIGLNGKDGKDGLTMKGEKGQPGLNGKDGITRIVYEDNNHDKHEVATLDDGLNFTGNNTDTVNKQKLNSLVKVQGEGVDKTASASFKSASGNINVKADGTDTLEVQLNKDLKNITTIKNDGPATLTIGGNEFKFSGGNVNMGDNNITNLKSGGDVINNAANIGDVKRISKANDLHIAPTTSDRAGETTTSYAYDTASKSVTLKYNDGNGANQAGTIAKIDLSGLADQIKDGYSFSTDAKGNVVGNHAVTAVGNGKTVSYAAGDNLTVKQDIDATTGEHTYTYALSNDIKVGNDGKDGKPGVDGKIGVNGKDGSSVVINGKDGSIGLNGKDGKDGLTMKAKDGQPGVNGKDGITRIVYEDNSKNTHEVATLDDGMKYAGDDAQGADKSKVIAKKLNETMDVVGGADKSKLTDNNIGVNNVDGKLKVQLSKEVNLTPSGSLTIGDTVVNNNGLTISGGPSVLKTGINAGNLNITNVKAGVNDTDAVNVKQLKDARTVVTSNDNSVTVNKTENGNQVTYDLHVAPGAAQSVWNVKSTGNTTADSETAAKTISDGKTVEMAAGKNLTVKQTSNNDGAKVEFDLANDIKIGNDGKDGKDGVDGKIGVNGKDGSAVVINGKDGSIGLNGKDGKDGLTMKAKDGQPGVNGKDGITRIVYEDKTNTKHEVATLDDGLKFTGNNTDTVNNHKLNSLVKVQGEGVDKTASASFKSASGNINVKANGTDTLEVQLNKDLKNITTIKNDGPATLTIGGNEFKFSGGNVNMGDNNITNLKSGGDVINNAANIGDVKRISKENDIHIKDKTYTVNTDKTVTLEYVDGNDNTINKTAKIDLSNLPTGDKAAVESVVKKSAAAGDTNIADITVADGKQTGDANAKYEVNVSRNAVKDAAREAVTVNTTNSKNNPITVTPVQDETNHNTTYQVTFDGNKAATQIPLTYKANGQNAQTVTLDKGLNFTNGSNTTASVAADGVVKYDLNNNIDLTPNGSLKIGDTIVNNGGLTISGGPSITKTGINAGNLNITNVKAGVNDTDAVNVKQLKDARTVVTSNDNSVTVNKTENGNQVTYDLHVAPGAAQSVWNVKSTGNTTADSETAAKIISDGKTVEMAAGKNLTVKQTSNNDGAKVEFDLANDIKIGNDGKDGKDGVDGKIGVNGKDGSSVVINGKDGSIGLNGKDGKDGLTMKAKDGQPGVNGKDGITRIVYEDNSKNTHEVATLDDGMKYAGDDAQGADKSKVIAKKLNETMDVVGGADKSKLTDNNIGVNNVDGKLKVQLSKEVNLTPSGSLTIGDTVVNNNGLTISGGPSITKTGINAGNKTIVNVDAGVNDTDAVNVAQLKKAKTEVKAGNNVTVDTTYGNDGHTIYTVNANDVALGDAVLKYSANGTNTQSVKLSQGLNFVDGNYTSASVDANGQVKYDVTIGKVKDGVDGKPGVDGKDGIATVKTVVDTINNSGWKGDVTGNTVNNHAATIVKPGTTVNFGAGKNLTVEQIVDQVTGDHTYNYALSDDIKVGHDGKDGKPGVDGKIGVNGKDGSAVVINGKDGSIGLNGKDGKDGLTIRGEKGQDGVDGKNGANGITRIVYEDNSKNTHEVATLDDGMKYAGDDAQGADKSKVIAKKLNETMDVVGGADKSKLTDNNIGVNNDNGKLKVQLSKEVNLTPSGSLTIGDTVVNNNGLTISGGPSIIKTGINAGNLNITNVKAGVNDTDAVNVKQLKDARTVVTSNDNSVTVNKTENGNQVTYDLHVAPGAAQSVWNVKSTGNTTADSETAAKTISDGKTVEMAAGKNLTVKQTSNTDGAKVEFDLANDIKIGNDGKDGKDGVDGKIGVNGKDGSSVVINGKDGSIGLNGKDGKDGLTMKGEKGQPGLNGKDGITRIVYEDNNHDKHEVATLDDGLNFTGNNTDTVNKQKLNSLVKVQGEGVDKTASASFKSASGNINVKADGTDTLEVQLNKDLNNINTIKNGGPATFTIGGNEFKFDGGNVNMGGNNITNLKSGIVNNNSTDDTNGANIGDVKTISKANDIHVKDTRYTVNADKTVTLEYVDGNDKKINKTAVIDLSNLPTGGNAITYKANNQNAQTVSLDKGLNFIDGNYTKASVDADGIVKYDVTIGKVKDGVDGKPGVDGNDGIATVKTVVDTINNSGWKGDVTGNTVGSHTATIVKPGTTVNFGAGKNVTVEQIVNAVTGDHTYNYALSDDIKLGKDGKDGVDGRIGVNGKDGSSVVINGKDGSIGLNGKDGKDGLTMKAENGQPGLNGKDGITRIVYEDKNNNKHEVATLDDGLRFTGNNEVENKQKLGSLVKIKGEGVSKDEEATFESAKGNIAVTADGTDTLTVRLNKNIKGIDSIQTKEIHLGTPDNYTTIKKDGDRIKYGDKTIANTDELWTIQANGTDVPANGGKVNVKGTDGITVSRTANGEMTISGSGLGTMNSFNVKSTGNTADGSETAAKKITDGKTVEFSGGNNVTVKQTSSGDGAKVEFALKNNIDLTQDGSVKIGDTKITNGGLVINNGPSITKAGINAGNKQITNVEDGVNDTDAVNVRQLKDAKTKLVDGQNTTVTGDGSKANPYKVNVEGDLNKITSITNKEGDGKLEFKGDQVVNVAGDNTIKLDGKTGDITGLTNKTLDSADFATKGRAATEEQLKLVQQEAAKKSTEKVQAKADANNIAKVAPKAGDTFGAAGATYEVSVDKNDVKDVAREAVTVSGDKKAITVDVQPNATNHTTNYQVNFNGTEAAKQIPLTYKENGGNARTVMLSDGLDFSNGVNTTAHTDAKGKVSFDVKGDLTNITSISNNSNGPKMSFGGDSINITGGSLSLGDNFIHNVKAGEKNTDAVNVSQLKAAKTEVEAGRNVTVEHRLGENGQDIYKVNAEAAADPRVDQLGEEIGHVGAQSAALSALKPIQYDPMEPTQIMAGYGNYRGNSALALGVAHYKNESTMFHAGVSWAGGNGHMMANAGVTWKVGNKDSEAAVADHYRKGPISSTYAMQTEVASMKAQNAGLKGEVSDLKAENEQIKAQNAGLQSEVDQLKAQMAAMMAKLGM